MNLLDLIRTYKTKKILRKTGGEETTTKLTTTYAKKTYANLSQKKVQFFHLTIRKIVPTIKKQKHHPPSYQKVAYTFQNDIKIKELYKKLL